MFACRPAKAFSDKQMVINQQKREQRTLTTLESMGNKSLLTVPERVSYFSRFGRLGHFYFHIHPFGHLACLPSFQSAFFSFCYPSLYLGTRLYLFVPFFSFSSSFHSSPTKRLSPPVPRTSYTLLRHVFCDPIWGFQELGEALEPPKQSQTSEARRKVAVRMQGPTFSPC